MLNQNQPEMSLECYRELISRDIELKKVSRDIWTIKCKLCENTDHEHRHGTFKTEHGLDRVVNHVLEHYECYHMEHENLPRVSRLMIWRNHFVSLVMIKYGTPEIKDGEIVKI